MESPKDATGARVHSVVHTPGPWLVEHYDEPIGQTGDYQSVTLIKPDARERAFPSWIAEVSESDNQDANAKLIAAAPEMLAALEAIIGEAGFDGLPESKQDKIYAAIEKATN